MKYNTSMWLNCYTEETNIFQSFKGKCRTCLCGILSFFKSDFHNQGCYVTSLCTESLFSFQLLLRSQKNAVKYINRLVFDQIFNEYRHSLHILGTRGEHLYNAVCYLCLCWKMLNTSPHCLPSAYERVNYFWPSLNR